MTLQSATFSFSMKRAVDAPPKRRRLVFLYFLLGGHRKARWMLRSTGSRSHSGGHGCDDDDNGYWFSIVLCMRLYDFYDWS